MRPPLDRRTVTSPCASVPLVMLFTEYNCSSAPLCDDLLDRFECRIHRSAALRLGMVFLAVHVITTRATGIFAGFGMRTHGHQADNAR